MMKLVTFIGILILGLNSPLYAKEKTDSDSLRLERVDRIKLIEQRRAQRDKRRAERLEQIKAHRQQIIERIQQRFGEIQKEYQETYSADNKVTQQAACEPKTITLDQVNFAFDSDKLNGLATTTLDEVAKILESNPEVNVEVAGHTDIRGTHDYNDDLSMRRACSVVNYLKDKGITNTRLAPKAFGETKPVKLGVTEKDHAINRRVELAPQAQ